MEKGKKLKTVNGEISLPNTMIQLIQSFLSWKDAAQTTLLSKQWYSVWLARPSLQFDQAQFKNGDPKSSNIEFVETATNTMRSYQDLNQKIERFALRTHSSRRDTELFANKLISDAIKIGATDLNLQLRSPKFLLPPEVLGSENLLRLSVRGRGIEGKVNCWRLKSLTLDGVNVESDNMFWDLISCCKLIEELSISKCYNVMNASCRNYESEKFMVNMDNLFEHQKLRRLFLEKSGVDILFFKDFESRFPCLKDLSIVRCHVRCRGLRKAQIRSTSLERISVVQLVNQLTLMFDVPNIRKFCYSGMGIPSLYIRAAASREWESHISFTWRRPLSIPSLRRLGELLRKLSTSRITLSLDPPAAMYLINGVHEEGDAVQVREIPAVLESLRVEARDSNLCPYYLLVRLFGVCRPKLITHSWVPDGSKDLRASDLTLGFVSKILRQAIGPNRFIPDQEFDLEELKVEVYEENLKEWQPLPLVLEKIPEDASSTALVDNQKIRFQLKWRR